jgi:mannan endo-1,4-beta-mannosidase
MAAKPAKPPRPTPTPQPTPQAGGFVQRSGTNLTLDGQPYRFSGLNIYNANSRDNCWYALGNNDGALANVLDDIGPGKEAFRAWFFQRLATTNGTRDWSAFDHTLAVAKTKNVKVVVTLQDHWGACDNAGQKSDAWYTTGWSSTVSPGDTQSFKDYVTAIVTRYRNDPTILMWQLGNEIEGTHTPIKDWAYNVSQQIRAIDANHLISIGTIGSGQAGASGDDYWHLHNLPAVDICEYHDYPSSPGVYPAMPGDQWNGLQHRIDQCTDLGKPLFVGEVGIHLGEVGTTAQRATILTQKMDAQFAAGVDGFLPWAFAETGQSYEDYMYEPGDPALPVLAR